MKKIIVFLAVMLFSVTNCYATESGVNKNYVKFDIDTTYTNLLVEIYNNDTNQVMGRAYITHENNTYYYDKGLNIRIVDITTYSAYETLDDIILNDESIVITERKLKDLKVEFTTYYRGRGSSAESVSTDTDLTIYNEDFEKVGTCVSKGNCVTMLKAGKYFIIDNKTGVTAKEMVRTDRSVYVSRFFVDGIYSEDDLDVENVVRHGKLYYFNTPMYPEKTMFNGELVDFGDESKYYYIEYEGIFYKYSKKDQVINKEDTPSKDNVSQEDTNDVVESDIEVLTVDEIGEVINDLELDDEVLIEVPNTDNNSIEVIFFKRKYYI